MTNNTTMINYSHLRTEYEALRVEESALLPDVTTKIAVRLASLNPSEKTDMNVAADYCLNGEYSVVLVVLPAVHPMSDVFTIRGEARDKRVVEFIRNHLKSQDLRHELSRLEKTYC